MRKDGIIEVLTREGWLGEQKLEHAKEIIESVFLLSGGTLRPLLSELSNNPVSKEARDYYSKVKAASASALLVRNNTQKLIGNFFLGFNKVPIPIRMFSDRKSAIEWLKQYIIDQSDE